MMSLPPSIGECVAIEAFSVAGNLLTELPPSIGNLTACKDFLAYANQLHRLPEEFGSLKSLKTLSLQGNALEGALALPASLGELRKLESINLASNPQLRALPASMANLRDLRELTAYGTALQELPQGMIEHRALTAWLEGCPLTPMWTARILQGLVKQERLCVVRKSALGLDAVQWAAACAESEVLQAVSQLPQGVKVSSPSPHAALGYFKLERALPQHGAAPLLVVAFGSAPGVVNWAGALKHLRSTAMQHSPLRYEWDTMFIVDARLNWYRDEAFARGLHEALSGYSRVLLLGESMGGSGALLLSDVATRVLAFGPQVDFLSSVLRPGCSDDGSTEGAFTERLLSAVRSSPAVIHVHTSSWSNDMRQAQAVAGAAEGVRVISHEVDEHLLARALQSTGQLEDILLDAVTTELEGVVGRAVSADAHRALPSCGDAAASSSKLASSAVWKVAGVSKATTEATCRQQEVVPGRPGPRTQAAAAQPVQASVAKMKPSKKIVNASAAGVLPPGGGICGHATKAPKVASKGAEPACPAQLASNEKRKKLRERLRDPEFWRQSGLVS